MNKTIVKTVAIVTVLVLSAVSAWAGDEGTFNTHYGEGAGAAEDPCSTTGSCPR
jgi:hypothetical protein